jgi:DNA-binding response OmpR family regulator
MRKGPKPLSRRLLVVEDDSTVATAIADVLDDAGYDVVGPVRNAAEAFIAIEVDRLDGAILDFKLFVGNSLPVAEVLAKRGIPVLFVTGEVAELLRVERGDAACLQKPFHDFELLQAVDSLLKGRAA